MMLCPLWTDRYSDYLNWRIRLSKSSSSRSNKSSGLLIPSFLNPATVRVLQFMYAESVQKVLVVAVLYVEVQVVMIGGVFLLFSVGIQERKIQLQNRKVISLT